MYFTDFHPYTWPSPLSCITYCLFMKICARLSKNLSLKDKGICQAWYLFLLFTYVTFTWSTWNIVPKNWSLAIFNQISRYLKKYLRILMSSLYAVKDMSWFWMVHLWVLKCKHTVFHTLKNFAYKVVLREQVMSFLWFFFFTFWCVVSVKTTAAIVKILQVLQCTMKDWKILEIYTCPLTKKKRTVRIYYLFYDFMHPARRYTCKVK